MIAEAIKFHLEGLLEVGLSVPLPTSIAHEVEVLS
jgi:predicted RNase H-like HicB family nuclease